MYVAKIKEPQHDFFIVTKQCFFGSRGLELRTGRARETAGELGGCSLAKRGVRWSGQVFLIFLLVPMYLAPDSSCSACSSSA